MLLLLLFHLLAPSSEIDPLLVVKKEYYGPWSKWSLYHSRYDYFSRAGWPNSDSLRYDKPIYPNGEPHYLWGTEGPEGSESWFRVVTQRDNYNLLNETLRIPETGFFDDNITFVQAFDEAEEDKKSRNSGLFRSYFSGELSRKVTLEDGGPREKFVVLRFYNPKYYDSIKYLVTVFTNVKRRRWR